MNNREILKARIAELDAKRDARLELHYKLVLVGFIMAGVIGLILTSVQPAIGADGLSGKTQLPTVSALETLPEIAVTRDDFTVTELPPCPTEDSVNCYWNAQAFGNSQGTSFVNVGGTVSTTLYTIPSPRNPYGAIPVPAPGVIDSPRSGTIPVPSPGVIDSPRTYGPIPVPVPTETESPR